MPNPFPPGFFPRRCHSPAFSLIELLVVIAIIGILAALTAPAIPSMLGAKGVSRAVEDTSGILELARTEAMARRTYVYVAFLNTNSFGNSELRIGAVSSLDGSTNTSPDNLRPIAKAMKIDKTLLVKSAGDLPANVSGLATNAKFLTNTVGMAFKVGNVNFPASADGIIFSPNGEAISLQSPLNFIPQVDIGLVPTKGTTAQTAGQDGAVVRYLGGSGSILIFRP